MVLTNYYITAKIFQASHPRCHPRGRNPSAVTARKFEGVVDPMVFKATDGESVERCFQILGMMAAVAGNIYPGPLQDIEKGLKTEADFITGYCVDRAAEKGVPAPINTKIRQLLKQMETGDIKPSPDNISLLEVVAEG